MILFILWYINRKKVFMSHFMFSFTWNLTLSHLSGFHLYFPLNYFYNYYQELSYVLCKWWSHTDIKYALQKLRTTIKGTWMKKIQEQSQFSKLHFFFWSYDYRKIDKSSETLSGFYSFYTLITSLFLALRVTLLDIPCLTQIKAK